MSRSLLTFKNRNMSSMGAHSLLGSLNKIILNYAKLWIITVCWGPAPQTPSCNCKFWSGSKVAMSCWNFILKVQFKPNGWKSYGKNIVNDNFSLGNLANVTGFHLALTPITNGAMVWNIKAILYRTGKQSWWWKILPLCWGSTIAQFMATYRWFVQRLSAVHDQCTNQVHSIPTFCEEGIGKSQIMMIIHDLPYSQLWQ